MRVPSTQVRMFYDAFYRFADPYTIRQDKCGLQAQHIYGRNVVLSLTEIVESISGSTKYMIGLHDSTKRQWDAATIVYDEATTNPDAKLLKSFPVQHMTDVVDATKYLYFAIQRDIFNDSLTKQSHP